MDVTLAIKYKGDTECLVLFAQAITTQEKGLLQCQIISNSFPKGHSLSLVPTDRSDMEDISWITKSLDRSY